MGEHLLQIQHNVGTHVGVHSLVRWVHVTIREVNFLVTQIVDCHLQVARIQPRHDLPHCQLARYRSVVFSQQLMQPLVERGAQPIHAVIYCIFNQRMPVLLGELSFIIDHVADGVAVLEASELALAVSYSENQVACPFGGFHARD